MAYGILFNNEILVFSGIDWVVGLLYIYIYKNDNNLIRLHVASTNYKQKVVSFP